MSSTETVSSMQCCEISLKIDCHLRTGCGQDCTSFYDACLIDTGVASTLKVQVETNMSPRLRRACNKRLPLGHVRAFQIEPKLISDSRHVRDLVMVAEEEELSHTI